MPRQHNSASPGAVHSNSSITVGHLLESKLQERIVKAKSQSVRSVGFRELAWKPSRHVSKTLFTRLTAGSSQKASLNGKSLASPQEAKLDSLTAMASLSQPQKFRMVRPSRVFLVLHMAMAEKKERKKNGPDHPELFLCLPMAFKSRDCFCWAERQKSKWFEFQPVCPL